MVIEYKAIYLGDIFALEEEVVTYTYYEDLLEFVNSDGTYNVAEVLYNSDWVLFVNRDGDTKPISKYDFVYELELPYVEIDVI